MQISREQRWPCSGRVNLIVDVTPWKLRACTKAVNVSSTGICLRIEDPRQMKKSSGQLDLLPLIREGYTYGLQLENEQPEARAQPARATLIRKQRSGESFILGFKFMNPPPEIADLVQDLEFESRQNDRPEYLF